MTIKEILVQGIEPAFRRFRINIRSEYTLGSYWGAAKEPRYASVRFNNEMTELFSNNGWVVRQPESSHESLSARKHGQYLYIHPMEITGYVKDEAEAKAIERILAESDENVIFGFSEPRLGDDVYRADDSYIIELFARHRDEIHAAILNAAADEKKAQYNLDKLRDSANVPRNNETSGCGQCSSDIECVMLNFEIDTLFRMGKLNEPYRVY